MSRIRAFYSVVQYVPDGGRAEAANAGVVVYIPETGKIAVRTTSNFVRIKKFFAPKKKELRRIELAVGAFKHRLESAQGEFKSEKEFEQFITARADAVRMTLPRWVILSDPVQKLDELYAKLVEDEKLEMSLLPKGPFLPANVAEIFGRLEATGKVWRPRSIIVPETRRKLQIPLAYANGRVNFILPQSLARGTGPEARLQKLGFNGLLIHEHKIDHEDSQLVVMSTDEKASAEVENRYAEVLDDFHVRFVPFSETLKFASEVERTAH